MRKKLKVKHLQGWCFEVESRSNPGSSYLVQLDGEPEERCQCQDFWNRCSPAIRKGANPSHFTCIHLESVADYMLWEEIIKKNIEQK